MIRRLEEFRRLQQSLVTLSARDLLRAWRTLDLSDARSATDILLATVPDITAAYGDLAAVAAADLYDDLRAEFGPGTPFRTRVSAVAPPEQARAAVRWAVTPLWATDPRLTTVLSRLSGSTRRLTLQPARDTIRSQVRRDRAGYAVVPSGTACDWCAMLASRGAVYVSEETASASVMADRDWHDNCRCVVTPIWSERDLPDINRRLHDEWQQVASGADDPRKAWREHIEAQTVSA